MIMTCS